MERNPQVVKDAASSWGILREASLLLLARGETLGERIFAALPAPALGSRGVFALFLCCRGSRTPQPGSAGAREALRDPGGGSSCAPEAMGG